MEQWVAVAGKDVWWTEFRAAEGGRATLVRWTPGDGARDVLGDGWNVRNRLHEYGGRPFAVLPGGRRFVVTEWSDQRLWLGGAGDPVPLTPPGPGLHHADAVVVGDEVWCVREEVTGPAPSDRRRALVAIPLSGAAAAEPAAIRVLAATHRFLTGPKPSPDGRHVAWIGWNHPAMPWDGTQLCVAELRDGRLGPHRVLAGGPAESVCQAWWCGPDALVALTDPRGWWNPHLVRLDGRIEPLWTGEQEIGGPLWRVGASWSAPLAGGRIALLVTGWYERAGRRVHGSRLGVLDPAARDLSFVATPETVWSNLAASGSVVAAMAAGPDRAPSVLRIDTSTGRIDRIGRRVGPAMDDAWRPRPRHRIFRVPAGDGDAPVHAIVFAPRNPEVTAAAGDRPPPLLVTVHGGPTGHCTDALDPTVAFFTSRGFAVALVNYGGSTGHGRAYRERLRGQWGVVDVADCAAVATALADEGAVDRDRLLIRGGSAGGWTASVSVTGVGPYRCGTAYYPVVDLLGWARGETHDLESRYLDGLVGPLPEATATYLARSPVNRVGAATAPLLLLQGEQDPMCPPVQCERLVAALRDRKVPHAYLTFPGEQHGFRRAESIRRALEAELSFYRRVLGLGRADPSGGTESSLRSA